MKIGYSIKLATLVVLLTGFGLTNVQAQGDAGDFMKGGIKDAELLLGAYLSPFGETLGINMNSGWYNTAQPLKLGRFELRVNVPVSMVGESKRSFNPNAIGLSPGWSIPSESAPTVFGEDTSPGNLTKTIEGQTIELPLPPGAGVAISPLPPSLQLSVGLVKGTEIMARFIPTLSFGEATLGSWGLGVKHDVKQWIPGVQKLPFDLSVLAAYSQLNIGYDFEERVTPISSDQANQAEFKDGTSYNENIYEEQRMSFRTSAWNVNLIISKKLSVFTPYAGIRYGSSASNLAMEGTYGYVDGFNSVTQRVIVENVKDPITVRMPHGQLSVNAGFRLKLAIMTIFGEANLGKYTTYTGGIGFGWMN
jgi:hypothetical protein